MVNVVQLLCDLAEASEEVFRVCAMGRERGDGIRILTDLGAVVAGPRPDSVTCEACDADHSATIEFDAQRKCYIHSCPEAGWVTVDDVYLATLRFNPDWLVDWLAASLPVASPRRRPALVPRQVWHLGDTISGDTVITVVFARRVVAQSDLDQLAAALRTIHPADKGVVITTSLHVARQVPLPGGYELLALPEVVGASPNGLVLDTHRFGLWIRGIQLSTAKGGRSRVGRPSPEVRLAQIFSLRRRRGLPVESVSAEAKAILAEWIQRAPDQDPPGRSTVRRHVARLSKAAAPA